MSIKYNTKEINKIIESYNKCERDEISKISYRREIGTRKSNLEVAMTYIELREWARIQDINYFAAKYYFAQTPNGEQLLSLREYQKQVLYDFQNNRFNLVKSSRQMGLTTLISVMALQKSITSINNAALIICNKTMCCVDIIEKIYYAYIRLPFALKPGIVSCTRTQIVFDNGSSITATSNVKNALGRNINNIFIDSYAHMSPDALTSLWPLVATSHASVFIQSTPNGYNHFYDMVDKARRGENSFKLNELYWWQVPGRDDTWREQEIKNIGLQMFMQEYECQFVGKGTTNSF
jgi:hypothetical protein